MPGFQLESGDLRHEVQFGRLDVAVRAARESRLDAEVVTKLTPAQRRQLQTLLARIDPGETPAAPGPL
ncbi:MAG TPA: hypothetical protein VFU74_02630 [Actinocrinis sp.]|nr:hypothetical protein [Actinocrinis sp.]